MAPQLLVELEVGSLAEEVDVEIGQDGPERIGVVLGPGIPLVVDDRDLVRE